VQLPVPLFSATLLSQRHCFSLCLCLCVLLVAFLSFILSQFLTIVPCRQSGNTKLLLVGQLALSLLLGCLSSFVELDNLIGLVKPISDRFLRVFLKVGAQQVAETRSRGALFCPSGASVCFCLFWAHLRPVFSPPNGSHSQLTLALVSSKSLASVLPARQLRQSRSLARSQTLAA